MSKFATKSRSSLYAVSALFALTLSACGGGGGGGDGGLINPPAPAPAPSPAPAGDTVTVTTLSQQTAANKTYNVAATVPGTVVLTLPTTVAANDTVTINGQSANNWTVAQNAGQSIVTTNLAGNLAPGALWTPSPMAPKVWHWLSSDATGQVLLANEAANGRLNTSVDGGASWTTGNSPAGIWISSDMTADASRMIAVGYQGGMYMSTDRGATWTQMASSTPGISLNGQAYESVTISNDGQRIVAVIQNGNVIVSQDGGANWALGQAAGAPLVSNFRGVDSSADGSVAVSVAEGADVFLSTDAGANWQQITVRVGGVAVFENWYRVKMSADGNTIAIAANTFGGSAGTGIYVSHDRGVTWTKGHSLVADYTALAMSSDGAQIGATVSTTGGTAGRVLLSTDGGASFTQSNVAAGETNWRAIAMSADGNKLAVAAGLFSGPTTGQLYTSLGNRTSSGLLGSITGGQGDSVQLRYIGDGRFSVVQSSGGTFSIR